MEKVTIEAYGKTMEDVIKCVHLAIYGLEFGANYGNSHNRDSAGYVFSLDVTNTEPKLFEGAIDYLGRLRGNE